MGGEGSRVPVHLTTAEDPSFGFQGRPTNNQLAICMLMFVNEYSCIVDFVAPPVCYRLFFLHLHLLVGFAHLCYFMYSFTFYLI